VFEDSDAILSSQKWPTRWSKPYAAYLKNYETPRQATQELGRFFVRYNEQRQHQALGYQTPAAVYFGSGAYGNLS